LAEDDPQEAHLHAEAGVGADGGDQSRHGLFHGRRCQGPRGVLMEESVTLGGRRFLVCTVHQKRRQNNSSKLRGHFKKTQRPVEGPTIWVAGRSSNRGFGFEDPGHFQVPLFPSPTCHPTNTPTTGRPWARSYLRPRRRSGRRRSAPPATSLPGPRTHGRRGDPRAGSSQTADVKLLWKHSVTIPSTANDR